MSQRTSIAVVKELLDRNYHWKTQPNLQPHIDTATLLVDRMISCATEKGFTHTAAELEMIERWLAAYSYCKMDPLFASKSTQGASGSHVSSQSLQAEQERYKRGAIELDDSGCLNAQLNRNVARGRVLREDDPYNAAGTNPD